MRVAIDAVPLLIRSAGVKNYLYYWIDSLRRAAGSDEVRTVPAMRELPPLTHEGSIAGRVTTGLGLAALAASNHLRLPSLEWLARGGDVFHASSLVRNPPRRPRLTATIHDMTSFLMPELHPAANRRVDEGFAVLARRAHGLIAVSAATRDDAVRVLDLPPEKIEVIHSGITPAFFEVDPRSVDAFRARQGLTRPYALFVGTIEPRKNLDTLLDAWTSLPSSFLDEFELVIAGPAGWASAATMERVRQVRYLGYVSEAALPLLTAGAAVFVYPSLYEGFGFPVAQAMAAGVAVITSNVSSLPEVAGDAALLVDPRSEAELREGLRRLLLSPDLRADLAGRGRTRATLFRWENCAARSLDFFRKTAGC
jgi:alpha-1,3-rhamnosyl/mannosyltransferase